VRDQVLLQLYTPRLTAATGYGRAVTLPLLGPMDRLCWRASTQSATLWGARMSSEDKYRIKDKEQGFFDTLFGSPRHEQEIRDSEDKVVGTVREKAPSLFDELAGIDRH
jgi:hypothetical protein